VFLLIVITPSDTSLLLAVGEQLAVPLTSRVSQTQFVLARVTVSSVTIVTWSELVGITPQAQEAVASQFPHPVPLLVIVAILIRFNYLL
jgi:hypothetical protein